MNRAWNRTAHEAAGFTLIELMVVVLIIGILVAVAIPVFYANVAHVARKSCFAQQRTIESAAVAWCASNPESSSADLIGVITAAHPLVADDVLKRAPRCPSAPEPADVDNPDVSTGAYTVDALGWVNPCTFGTLGAHGTYQ